MSYQTISASGGGINSTVRATRDSSEAELLALAQPRLERLLREGVTTTEIKSGYGLDLPNERKMLRVARQLADHNGVELSATLLSAHATPPEYQGDADGYITLVCGPFCRRCGRRDCLKALTSSAKTSASARSKLSASFRRRRRWAFR